MRSFYLIMLPLGACAASPVPKYAPPLYVEPDRVIAITLNDRPFREKTCTPGSLNGFHGVELTSEEGARIRIIVEVQGDTKIIVFPQGSERGKVLADCSRAEMTVSQSRHGVSVRGRASMKCEGDEVKVEGTVMVQRCSG